MKTGERLKARASNETNDVKDRNQALEREIVTPRDGGCILSMATETPCNGYAKTATHPPGGPPRYESQQRDLCGHALDRLRLQGTSWLEEMERDALQRDRPHHLT